MINLFVASVAELLFICFGAMAFTFLAYYLYNQFY